MPMYQMGAHAPMSVGGATTEASTSYTASPQSAATVVYQQPLMSAVYQPQMDNNNNNNNGSRQQQQQAQRYTKSDDLQEQSSSSSSRAYQPPTLPADSSRSLSSPQALQSAFPSQSPPMPRHRPADDKSSSSVSTRTSALSLASITSPFNRSSDHHRHNQHNHQQQQHHHDQPKNYLAQTPTLGERLRPTSLVQGGPENLSPAVCRPLRAHPHPQISATQPIYT
jgi:hypothetical protein